jgi:hypothetical protein
MADRRPIRVEAGIADQEFRKGISLGSGTDGMSSHGLDNP